MRNIAIFASGSGSNAENIFLHFKDSTIGRVALFLTNNPDAYVIQRARKLGVDCVVFDRKRFYESDEIVKLLKAKSIDYVVLAGFLWLVPPSLIDAYDDRIVNIHPALLPAYGGKGMYGDNVHRAVVENRETESGITIHKVNRIYDNGEIIAQVRVPIAPDDTYREVANKVHALEYEHFPKVIESEIAKLHND